MDDLLITIKTIREALGTISIVSTRHNMNTLLGCMQLCDRCIEELNNQTRKPENKEGASNGESDL